MKQFEGRVAVITGAANGLGRQLASHAALIGMKLVLADSDAEGLARATGELQAGGADVISMVADVRKCAHVEELADTAMIRFHGVHLVFNNAGVEARGPIWENTEADWERVLGVNLWGVIHGVRLFTRLMLECARRDPGYEGHIVNTASMAGLVNAHGMGVVNVSRHAVVSLSESLYHDLRQAGAPIGASVLCPAVQSGEAAAAEVARMSFEAVRDGRFYVVPQPQGLAGVAARMEAIVHGAPPVVVT
jgi:NAD(P)-dependent dehydrogenase (short-subunit alcohol dehydrogenase family)